MASTRTFAPTVGIIGWGVVGQATGEFFLADKNNRVLWYDKHRKGDVTLARLVRESDFIFVCVPTPMVGDKIDLSTVSSVISSVAPKIKKTKKALIIKSSVVPGTTAGFAKKYKGVHFAMVPEFLTELNAKTDALNPDRLVVGALSEGVAIEIAKLHKTILPEHTEVFLTDPTTAEMVKYMANTFMATKIIFGNEMDALAQKLEVNYDDVVRMVGADKRLNESFFRVTPFGGFGGKCFPKDTVALLGRAKEIGVDLSLLKSAWKKNLNIRKVHDWEEIEGAVTKKK